MGQYRCKICGNTNEEYVGYINSKPYCRLCIQYEGFESVKGALNPDFCNASLELPYELTEGQKRISNIVYENIQKGRNCFISAVCGSGKTEMVIDVIAKCLKLGWKIGFAIPRRDVVIELYQRIKGLFKNTKVILVYGDHKDVLDADIIVLTTHQLYRYNCFFDLLILDEADAFPFKNNDVLQRIFKNSIKGNYVIMSATLDSSQDIVPDPDVVNLFLYERFHQHDIPVPRIVNKIGIFKLVFIVRKVREYLRENKPVLIFVPTIRLSKQLYELIKIFVEPGYFINSHLKNRDEVIEKFKKGEYKYLVTTMVLERGVTIDNLQVIIYNSDNKIYTKETLIQISGRVGRKKMHPSGDVILLSKTTSAGMLDSIKKIEFANTNKKKIT